MKKIIISLIVIGVIVGGFFAVKAFLLPQPQVSHWRTRTVERGELKQEVRATGTVQPIKNISVGTQVNGRILKLYVDYNDEVKQGQLIAQIDPAVYTANVAQDEATLAAAKASLSSANANLKQAEATVEQTRAKLILAQKDLARMKQLRDAEMIAQSDYDSSLSNHDALTAQLKLNEAAVAQAKASVEQSSASIKKAEAALQLSRTNLGYTRIYSPVDGVIIQRNVDEGQTVVSSMNAQTLFTIATDLSRIQIQADIPESDVGGIATNQPVTFTVDAYNGITFTGAVTQVRMASTTTQNVVTFPVIIEASNPNKRLFPGMTANIAVETGREAGTLKVPIAALRFTPPGVQAPSGSNRKPTLWLVGEHGEPESLQIATGISDGTTIAIKTKKPLENREVIVGVALNEDADKQTGDTNPFMPKMPGNAATRRATR